MAIVHVCLAQLSGPGRVNEVPSSTPVAVDTVTSSTTSAQASITAGAAQGQFWSVTATGNVYVQFGASPTAVTDAGWLIAAGQTREFAVSTSGEKIAIKDA